MNKVTPFQVVILVVFGLFLVFAVLIFSGIIPLFKQAPTGVGGEVTMWGTLPRVLFDGPFERINTSAEGLFSVKYVEKNKATFDRELVEALASGRGPDMILLPHDLIIRHKDKVFPIPYDNFSVRMFVDTFVEAGELYLSSDGILALPLTIDPIIMYYNRDMFSRASLSKPPTSWDEFFTLSPKLTKTDNALNILESAVALGEFQNIEHAKEILALLIMQAGNNIVSTRNGVLESALAERGDGTVPPAESAIRFFTEFSNSAKSVYSWNRNLPNSKDLFLAGDLAVYFGFASELQDIRAKSPHLNFDTAIVPQAKDAQTYLTYAHMTGLAVLKQSQNWQTAFYVTSLLSQKEFIHDLSLVSFLPPVRRDVLANIPPGASEHTLYSSALIARAWLDPSPSETASIFRQMVDSVTSGRERLSEAVGRASRDIERLLPR